MAKKRANNKKKSGDPIDPFGASVSGGKYSPAYDWRREQAKMDAKEKEMARQTGGFRGKEVKVPTFVQTQPTKTTPSLTIKSGERTVVVPRTDAFGNKTPYKDPMRGRTVEFGTRSMLEGIKGWMRGGGGSRITGK